MKAFLSLLSKLQVNKCLSIYSDVSNFVPSCLTHKPRQFGLSAGLLTNSDRLDNQVHILMRIPPRLLQFVPFVLVALPKAIFCFIEVVLSILRICNLLGLLDP